MAQTDDFNRASLGSNWTNQAYGGSVPGIVANQAWSTTAGSFAMMYWSAHTWNAAHHAKIQMLGTNYVGPGVRHSGSGAGTNCYVYFSHGSLQKFVGGTQSVIASLGAIAPAGAVNGTIELDVTGNSTAGNILQTTKDGVLGTAAPPDFALNAGAAGMAWFSNTAGGDNWVGTGEVVASTGYTLTALGGTYAQTGTPAVLRAARTLTAGGATYALTGTNASLRAARRLVAGAGAYTLTGTSVDLRPGNAPAAPLTAVPGVYALTGTAATLRVRRVLQATPGSYVLTGTPAVLSSSQAGDATRDPVTTTFHIRRQVAATFQIRRLVEDAVLAARHAD